MEAGTKKLNYSYKQWKQRNNSYYDTQLSFLIIMVSKDKVMIISSHKHHYNLPLWVEKDASLFAIQAPY